MHKNGRLRENGTTAFGWWIIAELAGYALVVAFASDARPACSWICFSERELLIYLALTFGLAALAVQVIVGLMLTNHLRERQHMSPGCAGTAAYFGTLILAGFGLVVFWNLNR